MMCVAWLLMSNMADRVLLSVLGVGVSLYALRVEVRRENDPQYRAVCDFSDRFSCSKALCSPYGKGFGIVRLLVGKDHFLNQRNCTVGILFYLSQIVLAFLPNQVLCSYILYYTSVIAGFGCVYLAFILFFVLRDICIVCIGTYVINAVLIYLNYNLYLSKHPGP
ncbi:vitamin K epoxide reductase complex subunit 1-like protein 1 [Haliotis cracherodii]|uniref:vitamin K epoxide reductase complex subunit 1-like protein 1 n=1 Tax=Haliotis cracherodii TaxID=6455 RepID=UPI0039EA63D1